jgi:hypothetical protein
MSKPTVTQRALRYLAANGPSPADMVGGAVWDGVRRGHVISSNGGGDYAAQMLLGRLRKAGLVRVAHGDAHTSQWELTELGRREAIQYPPSNDGPVEVQLEIKLAELLAQNDDEWEPCGARDEADELVIDIFATDEPPPSFARPLGRPLTPIEIMVDRACGFNR